MGKSPRTDTFIPANLLINLLASYTLISFDFLPSQTAHFDKTIILQFLGFRTFGFLVSVLLLHFKQ